MESVIAVFVVAVLYKSAKGLYRAYFRYNDGSEKEVTTNSADAKVKSWNSK